jgi:CHAT domain-containing protein/Tfp pilus assembly protein PilF
VTWGRAFGGWLLLLVLADQALVVGPAAAQELTPEERQALERQGMQLDEQAGQRYQQGRYAETTKLLHQVLEIAKRLYPKEQYPQGHPNLATSLNHLGLSLRAQGEYGRALPYLQDALAMRQKLYPKEKYAQGHPHLAESLNNLGNLLHVQGEYGRALQCYQDALAMYQQLYPKEKYPQGHPDLALSLNNLGALLWAQGEYGRALPYYQDALAMDQRLYPKEKYPQGHPNLATTLNSLGVLLSVQGENGRALPYLQDALAMRQALYPKEKYAQGHPHLAMSLNNLGHLLHMQGEYGRALPYVQDALAMFQLLHPKEQYAQGHPDLAQSLFNLGFLLQAQGKHAEALPYAERALAMRHDLFAVFAALASEAEALNYADPWAASRFLSVTRSLDLDGTRQYAPLWRSKAASLRLLAHRQQALAHTADDETRHLWTRLQEKRRHLARLLLAPAGDAKHRQRLQQLSDDKEDLERQLARKLPALKRQHDLERLGPKDLLARLPNHTVFIDLYRYLHFQQDAKKPGRQGARFTQSYVAFVVRQDQAQPIVRIELGAAAPIDEAVAAWRRALAAKQSSPAAETLRRSAWDKLAKYLPAGTQTVLLAPDGPLTGLPWAALPGNQAGTVLLEDYALAVVPSGPWLLERWTPPAEQPQAAPKADLLLSVGGVQYDQAPKQIQKPDEVLAVRAPPKGVKQLSWPYLKGTLQEVARVGELAGKRSVLRRQGAQASTAQLLADLSDSKRPVRWLHVATHGFFADPSLRSVLQLDEKQFELAHISGKRTLPGARNPLTLSGLVLAGANLPVKDLDKEDGGILTAEAIAGLPLQNLELAVLSACETGLGQVGGGEGVFGLQRAFHLAGAHNVIASLWKVDDEATAALMGLFYHHLWEKKQPPLQALREAQLFLYRHPEQVAKLAGTRALNLSKVIALPKTEPQPPLPAGKAPTHLWAGFVLSGTGQ